MGVGLMQIGAGLESAFGISQSNFVYFLVAAFIGVMFVIMSVSGIHKGLKYVSTITFFISAPCWFMYLSVVILHLRQTYHRVLW